MYSFYNNGIYFALNHKPNKPGFAASTTSPRYVRVSHADRAYEARGASSEVKKVQRPPCWRCLWHHSKSGLATPRKPCRRAPALDAKSIA